MKEELLTDALLREFLMGKVDDAERERLENLFLTDSEARERVLLIEQELTDDYLENNLTKEDRKEFLLRYGQTSEQQQQLRISKAIKDWAIRENAKSQPAPVTSTLWNRLLATFRSRPVFVIPVAATIILAIVFAAVWVNSRTTGSALAHELAELNSPASLRQVPAKMSGLKLSPITVRGSEQRFVLKRSAEDGIVELSLPWPQKERYEAYRVEVRRVGGDELFTLPNLQAQNDDPGIIRLRLPARILSRGDYQVRLTGTGNNVNGPTEEYSFSVDG